MVLTSGLQIYYKNKIQFLVFNNEKKRNSLNSSIYREIIKYLNDASKNPSVVMSVFTGSGLYYSSGQDFRTPGEVDLEDAIKSVKDLINCLIDHPKLLVAVVNGPAIGIACTTLALFDAVYAHENATFHTPFTNLGITAEGCSSYLFPRIFGKSRASRLLYFSEKIGAVEGLNFGLVTELYSDSTKDFLWEKLKAFSNLPSEAVLATKRLISDSERDLLHKVNEKEIVTLTERLMSDEFLNLLMKKMSSKL